MTDTANRIIEELHKSGCSLRVWEIAARVTFSIEEIQPVLHQLDDDGRVFMRNGWYRLSEAERERRA